MGLVSIKTNNFNCSKCIYWTTIPNRTDKYCVMKDEYKDGNEEVCKLFHEKPQGLGEYRKK